MQHSGETSFPQFLYITSIQEELQGKRLKVNLFFLMQWRQKQEKNSSNLCQFQAFIEISGVHKQQERQDVHLSNSTSLD